MVLFTKYSMDSDKPFPEVNLPPVRFIGGPTKQVTTVNIHEAWETEILVAIITMVVVPVEEALSNIGMNTMRAVINLVCDGD